MTQRLKDTQRNKSKIVRNMKALSSSILLLLFVSIFISCDKEEEEPNVILKLVVGLGEDLTVLEGTAITLYAGNAGATYLWSTGEVTQTIMVDTTGIFWVNVSNEGGSASDTVAVDLKYKTIQIETNYGNFRIWLYTNTPLHRANFIDLTEDSFYDNLIFHRVINNFVIQGGDPAGTGSGGPGYTIPAEFVSGLSHVYGALGAARLPDNQNPEKESNGSQFYIVTNPNGRPDLDGDYTVFGFVFNGIENAYEISEVPVDGNSKPIDDVIMNLVILDYLSAKELEDVFGFVIP